VKAVDGTCGEGLSQAALTRASTFPRRSKFYSLSQYRSSRVRARTYLFCRSFLVLVRPLSRSLPPTAFPPDAPSDRSGPDHSHALGLSANAWHHPPPRPLDEQTRVHPVCRTWATKEAVPGEVRPLHHVRNILPRAFAMVRGHSRDKGGSVKAAWPIVLAVRRGGEAGSAPRRWGSQAQLCDAAGSPSCPFGLALGDPASLKKPREGLSWASKGGVLGVLPS
jgi:hypothetical protein